MSSRIKNEFNIMKLYHISTMNLHLGVLQKPDRLNIGKAVAAPKLVAPAGIPEDVFERLHPDIQKNLSSIVEILRKHSKVPQWEESSDQISIRCNFNHVFRLSAIDVMNYRVRCPLCRVHAEEIFKEIYAKKQINTNVFEIRRINKFGQLSLRCLKSDHKLQISSGADFKHEVPDCCPECIVDDCPESSPFITPSDMGIAMRLQKLATRKESDYDELDFDRFLRGSEVVDSDPEFGSYKMNSPEYQSDNDDFGNAGYDSPDLDLISDIEDAHSPRHSRKNSDRCCSDVDDAYVNYFGDPDDPASPEDPYQSLERLFIQHADEYDACKARAHME
jgi:hypothetical protein